MPDADGNIKGSGWTRKREDAWTRVFGSPPLSEETLEVLRACRAALQPPVPIEPAREVCEAGCDLCRALDNMAEDVAALKMKPTVWVNPPDVLYGNGPDWDDAEEGHDPEEEADHQAARDGLNPEW